MQCQCEVPCHLLMAVCAGWIKESEKEASLQSGATAVETSVLLARFNQFCRKTLLTHPICQLVMHPDRMLSVAPLYKITTTWHRIFASSGFLSFCWRWAVCSLWTTNARLWISSWYEISTNFPTEETGRKWQGLSTQPWGAPVLSTRVKEVIASPKCLQSVYEDVHYPVEECGSHWQELKSTNSILMWPFLFSRYVN